MPKFKLLHNESNRNDWKFRISVICLHFHNSPFTRIFDLTDNIDVLFNKHISKLSYTIKRKTFSLFSCIRSPEQYSRKNSLSPTTYLFKLEYVHYQVALCVIWRFLMQRRSASTFFTYLIHSAVIIDFVYFQEFSFRCSIVIIKLKATFSERLSIHYRWKKNLK